MGKGPQFVPEGFDGAYAPSGADPDALQEMRRMQREDRGEAPPPASKSGATGRRAPERRPQPPDESVEVDEGDDAPPRPAPTSRARHSGRPARDKSVEVDEGGEPPRAAPASHARRGGRLAKDKSVEVDEGDEPPRAAPASRARRSGRPAKENRAQRVVRLTAQVDACLRQLAEFRGIDLNAAVSVAIAEDWRRVFDLEPIAGRRR